MLMMKKNGKGLMYGNIGKNKWKYDDETMGPLRRKIENIGVAILDMIFYFYFFGWHGCQVVEGAKYGIKGC